MPSKQELWFFAGSSAARLARSLGRRYRLRPIPRPATRKKSGSAEKKIPLDGAPAVFLADLDGDNLNAVRTLLRGRETVRLIGIARELGRNGLASADLFACLPQNAPRMLVEKTIATAFANLELAERERAAREELRRAEYEMDELNRIGVALSSTRDVKGLLQMILSKAREITGADAGSLYLVEKGQAQEGGAEPERRLRFKLTQNDSLAFPFAESIMPLNENSMAGYVALHGEVIQLADAYAIPDGRPYRLNPKFDQESGYRTRSTLTLPMKDVKGEVHGVLQLINCKRDPAVKLTSAEAIEREVQPFPSRAVRMALSLASQAAVAYENSKLYEDIETLFEGFVNAAVTAIEQRDPTTFGHSGRVAGYTVNLAKVVDRADAGPYRQVRFTDEQLREIRYAGYLHDFGKVGVREQVLVKAKKLYPPDLEMIRQRHAFIRRSLESEHWRGRAEYLETKGREGYEEALAAWQAAHTKEIAELDRFLAVVLKANEPTMLPEGSFEELKAIAEHTYEGLAGDQQPLLTSDEVRFLTIRKGSLDEAERIEIESHVKHTYKFLQEIPWTRELRQIPIIAYGHHEKLDGTGYPQHISGDAIPIQTRMMTISDIYDALTAQDRPYKPAVAPERALDILTKEFVDRGQLDTELFRLFIEAKVFETTGT